MILDERARAELKMDSLAGQRTDDVEYSWPPAARDSTPIASLRN